MGDVCKEILTRVPHAWLLPNLFHLIWTRLRDEPMGDTSNWPEWSLKVGMSNVEPLLLGHWYEIMALYYVKLILTEISASRQDRRVLQKSKIIRIEFLSKWGMLQTSRYV